jgi:uncharacterized membrane protein YuzA (DUF378 family)
LTNSEKLRYSAAVTTFITGILHLTFVPNLIGFSGYTSLFFLITGIAQLFWVVPILKKWSNIWYYAGMGGTFILLALWLITRVPNNRILNRALPVNDIGIVIEVLQTAFLILCGLIIVTRNRELNTQGKETELKNG